VKEDVEDTLEIERRQCNIVFHGILETDAEKEIDSVAAKLGEGLYFNFDRHVLARIGGLVW
jgi:hypothetical protein